MIYEIKKVLQDIQIMHRLNYTQYVYFLEPRNGSAPDFVDMDILAQALDQFSEEYDAFEFLEQEGPGCFTINLMSKDNDTPDFITDIIEPYYKPGPSAAYSDIKDVFPDIPDITEDLPF